MKDLNIHFMKEDTAISNMHMKRGLTSLTIRQAQTETIIFIATSEENDHTHTKMRNNWNLYEYLYKYVQ